MNDELRALIRSESKHAEAMESAYAAVYALIDEAKSPASTNALIWSCVHAALTAYTRPTP